MAEFESQAFRCEACGNISYTLQELLVHNCSNAIGLPNDISFGETEQQPVEVQSSNAKPDPGLLDRWEDRHVRLLITTYSENKHLFSNKGKTTKKQIFRKIAAAFNLKSDKQVSADQCMRKWQKLESKYKEIEDHNKQTGRDKKNWKFLDQMSVCLGSSPKINPAFTIDTLSAASSTSSSSLCDDDDDKEDAIESSDETGESRGKKVKLPSRKRKSHSSAAEMIGFLQSYGERREKAEAEKLELLRSMKEEKNEFFSQFLEILKKKKDF